MWLWGHLILFIYLVGKWLWVSSWPSFSFLLYLTSTLPPFISWTESASFSLRTNMRLIFGRDMNDCNVLQRSLWPCCPWWAPLTLDLDEQGRTDESANRCTLRNNEIVSWHKHTTYWVIKHIWEWTLSRKTGLPRLGPYGRARRWAWRLKRSCSKERNEGFPETSFCLMRRLDNYLWVVKLYLSSVGITVIKNILVTSIIKVCR